LTASIMRAAPTSASRRDGIGVGPACASWPVTVTSYRPPALRAGDDPDWLVRRFEDRPLLDMRLEIGATGLPPTGSEPAKPILSNSAPRVTRARLSGRTRPSARSKTPANTPEPIVAGEKREPSSLVEATISIGASVSYPRSFRVRTSSSPAITP
jgi:hypothetical protein